MRVLIRADGGKNIGMGHVMRMLVLADKLNEFAEVLLVCRNNEEFRTGADHIEACGYKVLRVDETRLLDELSGIGGDCLITDSYNVDERYFNDTKAIFNTTGYMDDLNKCYINTDFIINQNIYAEDLKYKVDSGTRLFMGTRYALLREEFRNLPRRNISFKIQDVLVTLGGADSQNMSEGLALKLSKSFPEIRFHIVVGQSFTHIARLEKLEFENVFLSYNPKMSELMLKCDIAISACGGTIYELCACGTPIIGVVTADNQTMAASKMCCIGALKYARSLDEVAWHLKSLNYEERVKSSEIGKGLVDGLGSTRVAQEIREIVFNKV